MTEVKTCRRCGNPENQYIIECSGVFIVRCKCGAEGLGAYTKDEAIENWNRRV